MSLDPSSVTPAKAGVHLSAVVFYPAARVQLTNGNARIS